MFDTVIVPLDGTPHAEFVIPAAVDEARRHGATIVLLHVIPRPEPCPSLMRRSGPSPWQGEWPADEMEAAEQAAQHYLSGVASRFRLGPKTTQRVRVGHPGNQIATEARRYARPLIVLTTGERALAPQDRSHVASYLLAGGSVPILGVREPVRPTNSDVVLSPAVTQQVMEVVAGNSTDSVNVQ